MADFEVVRRDSDKRILRGAFGDLSGEVGAGETRFVLTDGGSDWVVLEGVSFDIDQVKFDGGDAIVLKTAGEVLRNEIIYELTDDAAAHDTATGFPELDADGASFFTVTIQKQGKDGTDLTDAGDTDVLELRSTGGFITNTSDVVIDSITLVAGTADFRFHSTSKTHAAQIQVISTEDDAGNKVTSLGVFLKDGGTTDGGNTPASLPLTFRALVGGTAPEVGSGFYIALEMEDGFQRQTVAHFVVPAKLFKHASAPINYKMSFVVTGVGTGDGNVRMRVSTGGVKDGEIANSIGGVETEATIAVTNSNSRVHNVGVFSLDSTLLEDLDHVFVVFERLGADGLDTFDGDIGVLIDGSAEYTKEESVD